MAFTGDLEYLPIVDVIQLVNSTRKSGTLTVNCEKGESRLIFSEGNIVGANHLNSRVRIGSVLKKMGLTTEEQLQEALEVQNNSGDKRKPLIETMIDMGKIKHEDAIKGLKKLVEMTVVELVGWKTGSFTLDTDAIVASAESSYKPGEMEQQMSINAQLLLMDALRIFDEIGRDGKSDELVFSDEEMAEKGMPPEELEKAGGADPEITADDLGLDDLDQLDRKIPEVFKSVQPADPADVHRKIADEYLSSFAPDKVEILISFLLKHSGSSTGQATARADESHAWGVMLFSKNELIKHCVTTVLKNEGAMVFSTGEEADIEPIIEQYLVKKIVPIIIFDCPANDDLSEEADSIAGSRRFMRERYPQVATVQLVSGRDYNFILNSFKDGVKSVLPRPMEDVKRETYVEDTIVFLETIKTYMRDFFNEHGQQAFRKLKDSVLELKELGDIDGLTFAILNFVSEKFERAITFRLDGNDLVAGMGIGVAADKSEGPTPPMNFRIPLSDDSLFADVVSKGNLFYGESSDEMLKKHLFMDIGAPQNPTVLLMPMKVRGKTVFITYADFGQMETSLIQIDELEIFASQAGLVLEKSEYRAKLENA